MMLPYRCDCTKGGLDFFSAKESPVCPGCGQNDVVRLQVVHWHSKTHPECEAPVREQAFSGLVRAVTCHTCRHCAEFKALVDAGAKPMPFVDETAAPAPHDAATVHETSASMEATATHGH